MFSACKQGHFDIVEYLVQKGSDISKGDSNGTTPLLVAIKNEHTEIAKFLINKGADINQPDHNKKSPLHLSVVGCHIDVVKLLIDKGALQSITDNENQTPFDLACKKSYADIVGLLRHEKWSISFSDCSICIKFCFQVKGIQLRIFLWQLCILTLSLNNPNICIFIILLHVPGYIVECWSWKNFNWVLIHMAFD